MNVIIQTSILQWYFDDNDPVKVIRSDVQRMYH